MNICAVVKSVGRPQMRGSLVKRHSRTGWACLAVLVRWWADCEFSGMTLSLQAMRWSSKSMSSSWVSRHTLSLSMGLCAPQGNCANWYWMSLGPRGDRLCRDRIREVMFEPSFAKKRDTIGGYQFGVFSLAPAIPQKQQIKRTIFQTRQNRKSVRLILHTAPIASHGIGLRLLY